MSKSRVLLILLLIFVFGVFIRSFFEIPQALFFIASIFSLLLLFVFYRRPKITIFSFSLLFFIFGAWRTDIFFEKANRLNLIGEEINEEVIIQKVSDSAFGQNLVVRSEKYKLSFLLNAPQYPIYDYGDQISVACNLKAIENRDAGFDYRMYMAKEGLLYSCEKAKVKLIAHERGNYIYQKIFRIKTAFEEKILSVIAQPEAALADGILFGGNAGLSKEIQNDFSKTGMTHIVAVSGYNVTIIAEYLIMLGIAIGLWRKQAIWFAIIGIILFVVMIGLPASAVRAGVMSSILLWVMKHGRLASAENAVIFAASIMLFINPLLLRYDIGFQLSFLATLGIVLTSTFWEKSFIKNHKALGITETIAMSLSAQVFVLPVIAYNFHMASLISLLANIFVLPVIPFAMLIAFLTSLTGFIFAPLSIVFSWLSYVVLFYVINIIHIFAQFPLASIQIENFKVSWIFVYYLILFLLIYKTRKPKLAIGHS